MRCRGLGLSWDAGGVWGAMWEEMLCYVLCDAGAGTGGSCGGGGGGGHHTPAQLLQYKG